MTAHDHTDGPVSPFYNTHGALNDERYQRAKELAGAAAMSTEFSRDSYAAEWLDGLADTAYDEVNDAYDRRSEHDPAETCNNPHQLVPSPATASRDDAWLLVQQLAAWRAVDWEAVLGQGWQPDDNQTGHPGYGTVHGPVVHCLTAPADPAELAELMATHLAERVLRLAVERRKDELEHTDEEEGDDD